MIEHTPTGLGCMLARVRCSSGVAKSAKACITQLINIITIITGCVCVRVINHSIRALSDTVALVQYRFARLALLVREHCGGNAWRTSRDVYQ